MIKKTFEKNTVLEDGINLLSTTYTREDGSFFAAYAVVADPAVVTLISGTAGNGYLRENSVDYVYGQMKSAVEEGHNVVAGINAGYFRRKYQFTPYGLSIRNGIEISPPHSAPRAVVSGGIELGKLWLGITRENELVFGSEENYGDYKGKLVYAVGGSHYLVKNERCCLTQEDTGYEPRSAVGIRKDGTVILLVIDGRQPGYSSGATNRETADVLLDLKAETGMNLDGGGSTNLSVRNQSGQIVTLNRPCEPRRVFDTLLLVRRQK